MRGYRGCAKGIEGVQMGERVCRGERVCAEGREGVQMRKKGAEGKEGGHRVEWVCIDERG